VRAIWQGSRWPSRPARSLLPDPEALAMARLWEDWAGQSLYFYEVAFRMLDPEALEKALDLICEGRPTWERVMMKVAFKQRYPKKLAQQGLGRLSSEEVERRFVTHLEGIDTLVGKRAWLVGDAPSIADVSVVAQLDEMVRTSRFAGKIHSFT